MIHHKSFCSLHKEVVQPTLVIDFIIHRLHFALLKRIHVYIRTQPANMVLDRSTHLQASRLHHRSRINSMLVSGLMHVNKGYRT